MLKMKKINLFLTVFLLLLSVSVVFVACNDADADKPTESTDESSESSESGTLGYEEMLASLEEGMTYRQFADILGGDGVDIGSGAIIYQWDTGGHMVTAWLQAPVFDGEYTYPDELIVQSFRIADKPTESTDESSESSESGTLGYEEMLASLEEGMTYRQFADILGGDGVDIGYGAIIYQWDTGGHMVTAWFQKPVFDGKYTSPDELIVQSFRVEPK